MEFSVKYTWTIDKDDEIINSANTMCDETFSQSNWNTLKFSSIYTLNITFQF